jgi:pimeloyl-ACP methyl ester carboxylesterase
MSVESGYVAVGGTDLYWESRGSGGPPLLLVHGGYGLASGFDVLADQWSRDRQVIAVELDGHGHTRRSTRPFRWETFADDLAAVIQGLGLDEVDLLGYSLGGGASLRCAIRHPSLVRRLILLCAPHRRDAWYPEVRAAFDASAAAEFYGLLGGGQRDAGWDGSLRSPSWLTILPGTHYDILTARALPDTVAQFTA